MTLVNHSLLVLALFSVCVPSAARAGGCPYKEGRFGPTPVQEAQCLLRTVKLHGVVADERAVLPTSLLTRVGRKTTLTREQLKAYLKAKNLPDRAVGGSPDEGTTARYFVIHDTSDPLPSKAFPENINDGAYPLNKLASRRIDMAHMFIARDGQSLTGHEYSESLRATKREKRSPELRGKLIHHELVQPRIRGGFAYHAVGPQPGFPRAQLKRLALLYVTASIRKGEWLVPAFHCVLDQGIPDGHDDPQNFDLDLWGQLIEETAGEIASAR